MIICKNNNSLSDSIALILVILAVILMLCHWHLNPEFRALNVGEPFVDANQVIPGANFSQLGFVNLHFTSDYAIGPKQCHPFYYTHNPPFSEILNGIYHRLGLKRIEQQRLVCMAWSLLSFIFFYLTMRLLVGSAVAVLCLAGILTNPYILYWGDNLFSSHQLMFIYLSLYCFLRHIHKQSLLLFFIACGAFFFASFSNYELIPLMVIFVLGLKILRIEQISNKQVLIFLFMPLLAFCLRNLLVIWAIGYHVWYRDLLEILLHRTLGLKTHFMEIYRDFPIVLWTSDIAIPQKYPLLLYLRLENIYGYGFGVLLVALMFPFVRRYLLPRQYQLRIFHLILVFFAMGIAWYVLFPQHTSDHFHSFPMLLFYPFASLIWAAVIFGIWQNFRNNYLKVICLMCIVFALASARILNFIPSKPFPGISSLRKYEGKVFITNCIPTLVEYYTKAPAGFCDNEESFKELLRGKHKFFLQKDCAKSINPEYFFSVCEKNLWCGDAIISKYFTLVERSPNYAIYRIDLKSDL